MLSRQYILKYSKRQEHQTLFILVQKLMSRLNFSVVIQRSLIPYENANLQRSLHFSLSKRENDDKEINKKNKSVFVRD